jgi:hypothetical protein
MRSPDDCGVSRDFQSHELLSSAPLRNQPARAQQPRRVPGETRYGPVPGKAGGSHVTHQLQAVRLSRSLEARLTLDGDAAELGWHSGSTF